jgi:hypothetical protein
MLIDSLEMTENAFQTNNSIQKLFEKELQDFNKNEEELKPKMHKLKNKWVLWCHYPDDKEWTNINNYKEICLFEYIEDVIIIMNSIPEILLVSCYFFLMKEKIKPIREEEINRYGGTFSYRISNKNAFHSWKELSYVLLGNTISSNNNFMTNINGISISPKKNFCELKIWMKNCDYKNPELITDEIKYLSSTKSLFIVHKLDF